MRQTTPQLTGAALQRYLGNLAAPHNLMRGNWVTLLETTLVGRNAMKKLTLTEQLTDTVRQECMREYYSKKGSRTVQALRAIAALDTPVDREGLAALIGCTVDQANVTLQTLTKSGMLMGYPVKGRRTFDYVVTPAGRVQAESYRRVQQ